MARHLIKISVKDEDVALEERIISMVNVYKANNNLSTQLEALFVLVSKGASVAAEEYVRTKQSGAGGGLVGSLV